MKKVVSLLLVAVLLFTLSFSCFAASSAIVGFTIDSVLSFVSDNFSTYSASIQKRVEAARGYYFYKIINDDYSSGLTVFDSSGYSFTDDILKFYFNEYFTACSPGHDLYDSNGDVFIQAAGFPNSPFSLSLLSFAEYHVMQQDDGYDSTFLSFKNYYNSFLARYLIAQGENATDPNPGKSGLDIAPGYVSSEELVEGIEKDNTTLTPKSSGLFLNSYRTNTVLYGQVLYKLNADRFSTTRYVLHDDGKSALLQDLYYIPFYMDKNYNYYYSEYQYHIYFAPYEGTNSDIALFIDVYSPSDLEPSGFLSYPSFSDKIEFNSQSMPFQIALSITSLTVFVYPDEDTYVNGGNTLKYNWLSSFPDPNNYKYYLPDKSSYENTYTGFHNGFGYRYDNHDYQNKNQGSLIDDLGFICSKSMISRAYTDIDTSKIPSGQIVTITGDTIYNYTITNPDTGESSGFGDYITNNYTYITNNYGEGESSGSGSGVGGNVTVGGSIDVGGSVGVDINVSVPDININVNGNGSGAGESGIITNPDDFTSADNVDLNKYYDEAVEQSTGFQNFLKDFFGFLPAELLGLILFAVGMAIVCRVFGR